MVQEIDTAWSTLKPHPCNYQFIDSFCKNSKYIIKVFKVSKADESVRNIRCYKTPLLYGHINDINCKDGEETCYWAKYTHGHFYFQ